MRFEPLHIGGAMLISPEAMPDHRGFFARTFCEREFEAHGLPVAFVQASISFNHRRGTVRGMHFQRAPSREAKLVRCLKGAIFDVLLDLRPASASYLRHVAVELSGENRSSVFIPHGVAHGFQTIRDGAEVEYRMTDWHAPELASGVRWNDPAFGIPWPVVDGVTLSDRDASYPDFDRAAFEASGPAPRI
jgi:dTDP-4-dehydrorhamnose 3,5-epimerase